MSEPTTKAGRKFDSAWPGSHLDRLTWHEAILAIEREAARDVRDRIRAAVGDGEAGDGLPHWHHASGGTSPNTWENDRGGVFVDRATVLAAIDAAMPKEEQP